MSKCVVTFNHEPKGLTYKAKYIIEYYPEEKMVKTYLVDNTPKDPKEKTAFYKNSTPAYSFFKKLVGEALISRWDFENVEWK